MKIRKEYTCPLEITHDIIRGKWKPIIIWQLGKESCSLSNLEKGIVGINQKMLLQHLDELIEFGIIKKKVYDGYPLKVEYSLTTNGLKMLDVVTIMQSVGDELLNQESDTH